MSTTILVIEDNQTNVELIVYLLKAFGYNLVTASDGQKGLEIALLEQPDLIICDLEMPGMNGYEVARTLSEQSATPHIPLIAVTAYAMVGDRDKVLASGFDGYLSKPITPETFVKQVEAFLPAHKRSLRLPKSYHAVFVPTPVQQPTRAVVLVVDDSSINLNLISSTLEPSGYTVIGVNTVHAAIERVQHNSIDLILSDLHMSPESGLSLLRHIKESPRLQSIPFIILTSSMPTPEDVTKDHALTLGATKFLVRPITPEKLLMEVEECLLNRVATDPPYI